MIPMNTVTKNARTFFIARGFVGESGDYSKTRAAAGPAANRADRLTYVAETGRRRRLKRNTSNPFSIKGDSRSCQRASSPNP